MIQTYTDIRFSLLLNSEMTNVKPNWISCLFGPHILFSKRISFRSQGKLWAAACVSASDVVYRSTWWGSGECRVKSSPGSARQVPGPARLGPGHTDSSPTSLFPCPFFFFFFFSTVICSSCLLGEICIYLSGCPESIRFSAHKGTVKAGSQPWSWSHSGKVHLSTTLNLQIRKGHQSWRPSSPTRFCYWSSNMGSKKKT